MSNEREKPRAGEIIRTGRTSTGKKLRVIQGEKEFVSRRSKHSSTRPQPNPEGPGPSSA